MKTTEEKIAVMQAYVDGKKIQRTKLTIYQDWEDHPAPKWNWYYYDYRIKPEPKCRPYASAKECFDEVKKHGGWIKDRNHEVYYTITDVGNLGCRFNGRFFMYKDLFLCYDWADDGSPCGIMEEE